MAAIPEAVVTVAGVIPAPRAAAAGDTVTPSPDTYVHVDNASGASINVTVVGKRACSQGVVHDMVVAVGAGVKKLVGPITAYQFGDQTTGLASVNYSATASVNVYAVRQ